MRTPRNTLQGTHSEHLLQREFFTLYLYARVLDGDDRTVADAMNVFQPETLARLRERLSAEALQTSVVLTDRLSNRVLAVHLTHIDGSRLIAVNARFKVDPDVLTHTLLEEFAHTQQVLEGVDFDTQRRAFAYFDRPYELAAKQLASDILGYDPSDYEVFLLRDEPSGPLYDHRPPRAI